MNAGAPEADKPAEGRTLGSVRFDLVSADVSWLRRAPGAAPSIVAHRGASKRAPENTLAAFRLAIELGARLVECDVHLSADGVPVVMHDERVDRTTAGHGPVAEKTLSELKALDAGSWFGGAFAGERVPTLDEALEECAGRARLFVELKRGGGAALVEAALARIGESKCDVAVISLGPEEVQGVARARPDLPLGFLVGRQTVAEHGADRLVQAAGELGATFFAPQDSAVDAALVAKTHDAALPVSVWTVDEPQRMRGLADLGVAAITTNVPDVALTVFS